jgi:hypothetical protein
MPRVSSLAVEGWLLERLSGDVRLWFGKALVAARAGGVTSDAFVVAWSGCGRRLGRAVIALSEAEAQRLQAGAAPFLPVGWGLDEAGRGALLLAAADGREPALVLDAVDELFRKGEMREQQAILRVLSLLPRPEGYVQLATEAVRSNVVSVLEALACDNPFPAVHMDELAFNQMVMKGIFNGLPLARVEGLARRNNSELRRIVTDFTSERRAAGRSVPDDLPLILGGQS